MSIQTGTAKVYNRKRRDSHLIQMDWRSTIREAKEEFRLSFLHHALKM